MLVYERRSAIVELLQHNGTVTVDALAKRFFVSPSTIRRDLERIGSEGAVRRTYGGAVLLDTRTGDAPMLLREHEHIHAKQCIASVAATYVRDGMTMMLDTSSTVLALVPLLAQFTGLTVITNGLKTAYMLNTIGHITTHCVGGRLREHNMAMVGAVTCRRIEELNVDMAFLSCRGLSVRGVTEASEEEAQVKKAMLLSADQSVLLCDATKVGYVLMNRVCDVEQLHALVTDAPLPENVKKICEAAGVDVRWNNQTFGNTI